MSKLLKRLAVSFMLLAIICLIILMIGFLSTNGEYPIPQTVDTDPNIPQIELGGITFHSETFGDSENPTLIVLHGGPGADYRYLLDLQVLADDYFVVFYDQRGAGLSTRLNAETLTVEDMIADLDRFVEQYSPDEPVYLIGHSWGAMLASSYIGEYPEKVARVVLAEPGALTDALMTQFMNHFNSIIDANFMMQAIPVMFESLHISDAEQRADYVAGRFSQLWEADRRNPYFCPDQYTTSEKWRTGATVANGILANAQRDDGTYDVSILNKGLHRYTNPVLILASACNNWLGYDLQQQHANLFPSAEVVVIENAGHYLFNDNLEGSLQVIREYFDMTE